MRLGPKSDLSWLGGSLAHGTAYLPGRSADDGDEEEVMQNQVPEVSPSLHRSGLHRPVYPSNPLWSAWNVTSCRFSGRTV